VIEFAGGLCLIAAVTLGGLLLHAFRRLRETRLACARFERERAAAWAVLDTVPLAGFRWPLGPDHQGVAVRTDPYPRFLARFDADDAARVEAARLALRRRGAPFSLTLGTRSGEVFAVEGRQAATGESVLWLLDESAAARALRADEEAMLLRELIDASPAPMWRADPDRRLIDCNRAYAFAVDVTREEALAQNRELAATDLRKTVAPATGTA
jgi:PAS domain-containing protein